MESCGGEDKVVSEGEDEDDEGEREKKSDGYENGSDEEVLESTSGSTRDDRPFILPKKWTVNDFLPTMSNKVFNTLCDCYQIPDNIPICSQQDWDCLWWHFTISWPIFWGCLLAKLPPTLGGCSLGLRFYRVV